MSRPLSPIVCDGPGCGKQKQEANHWWVVGVTDPGTMGGQYTTILIAPFMGNATWDERFKLYDFCGHAHALQFISFLMQTTALQSPGDHQESNPGSQGGQNNAK